jgi:hypothetical protein
MPHNSPRNPGSLAPATPIPARSVSRRRATRGRILFLPRRFAAPSFWCGLLAAPIFVLLGCVALVAGVGALSA